MTRILSFVPIFLLLLSALPPQRVAASDYLRYVERADKAAKNQEWDRAATYLVEALRSEPANGANVMLIANLGMMRFYGGRDSLALVSLTQARDMAPESLLIRRNRARVLRHMRRDFEAVEDLTVVVERDTSDTEALLERGMISLGVGDTATARRDFDRLERLRPDEPSTLLARAALLTDGRRFAEALPYFDRLLLKAPDADVYAARANCHLALNHLPEAAADIASGLEINPRDGELYYLRATLNSLRHLPDDARQDAVRARQLGVTEQLLEPFLK